MDHKPDQATTATGTAPGATTRTASGTTCGRCGTVADTFPLSWACSVENGRRRYFCDTCVRRHLRSIEGRLDSTWW
ncbi:hypothetical protein [Actinacidiphila sp. bgisy145]|uniref:hypothetical protein n=1 Tax=Actinacidiphila sp. bgisy145 TaxID=3413792 RepID=UPI003EBBD1F5